MQRTLQKYLAPALILLVSVSVWAGKESAGKSKNKTRFTAEAYLEHIKYLAGDELAGRAPGSAGSEKAAQYIIEHFQAAGCQPAGVDGGWYQPFEVHQGKRLAAEKALLEISGIDRQWKVGQDWTPLPFTEMEDVEGPLAFAGYGIQAAQYDYDDYGELDAEGKLLLIFRYEPRDKDPAAEFGGENPSNYAFFVRKARTAYKHGAKALLIVNPPNQDPDQDVLYKFDVLLSEQTYHLPLVHISRELADTILQQAGQPDLKTLQEQLDTERKSLARDLGLTVKLHPGVEPNTLGASNVLGLIPGAGGTTETIIVGAHRDHLGVVPRQFQRKDKTPMIHNGADDNASGTAAIMELARAIGSGPPLRRNMLFIAFDGEEMGLLGSRHYVKHPTIELENVRTMINFDMVGWMKQNKYTVFGTATAKEFPALVEKAAAPLELEYKAPRATGGSDHAPFVKHEIPVMFPFTGVHKEYHQPEDDWELIDADGAATLLQMWHTILVELANMEDGPTYTEPPSDTGEYQGPKPAIEENAEFEEKAAARESDEPPSRTDMQVRLGIIPDMVGDGQPGMIVDSVLDGGCAKAAGIQDGDRIMKIGEEEIRDIYAYMRALGTFKPGAEVDVLVIRQDKEKTLKVKLQATDYKRGED